MAIQLTKEQVAKLSDQELDAYARVVLDEARSRRATLDRARNYRGRQIIPAVIPLVVVAGLWISTGFGWELIGAFLASTVLMQWHAAGINRRIDSLLVLIELDSKTRLEFQEPAQNESNDSASPHPESRAK